MTLNQCCSSVALLNLMKYAFDRFVPRFFPLRFLKSDSDLGFAFGKEPFFASLFVAPSSSFFSVRS